MGLQSIDLSVREIDRIQGQGEQCYTKLFFGASVLGEGSVEPTLLNLSPLDLERQTYLNFEEN